MIWVEVRLHASLTSHLPTDKGGRARALELGEGATIRQLCDLMGISVEEVVVSLVDGLARPLDHTLEDGDRVDIFPPLAGG